MYTYIFNLKACDAIKSFFITTPSTASKTHQSDMHPPSASLCSGTPYNSGMPACQRHPAMHDPDEFFLWTLHFQLVAFGFNQNNLSAGRANDKIRVMVAESVQTERKLVTLRVAMPPADIVHVGHCQSHFIFQTIHLALGLVQALAH